jgi:Ca2+-binding RTX toxin-like protein
LRLLPATAVAAALLAVVPGSAAAAYNATVDGGSHTATLTGSGPITLSTAGGVVRHDGSADFDSAAAGEQTVPDSGGWTVNVTGGGKDALTIEEGEPTDPVAFAAGHTFFPGGVPCVVRDPAGRGGAIAFSLHPAQETRFCYPGGIDDVTVRAGSGATQFTVLDTEEGVPLHLVGGARDDSLAESANVPSSVGELHNPLSAVHFMGGPGSDDVSLVDGDASAPAAYTLANGRITKTGLAPIVLDDPPEGIELYPQSGKSTIVAGPTGAQFVQIFGDFFGQEGPDRIDARRSDAALIASGSTGADTILGSAGSDYLGGGGGADKITSRDDTFDTVQCEPGSGTVSADTIDKPEGCATVHAKGPLIGFLVAAFKPESAKRGKSAVLDAASTVDGKLTLSFKRKGKRVGTRGAKLVAGPNTLHVHTSRKWRKGSYKVSARVRSSDGKRGPSVTLPLKLR